MPLLGKVPMLSCVVLRYKIVIFLPRLLGPLLLSENWITLYRGLPVYIELPLYRGLPYIEYCLIQNITCIQMIAFIQSIAFIVQRIALYRELSIQRIALYGGVPLQRITLYKGLPYIEDLQRIALYRIALYRCAVCVCLFVCFCHQLYCRLYSSKPSSLLPSTSLGKCSLSREAGPLWWHMFLLGIFLVYLSSARRSLLYHRRCIWNAHTPGVMGLTLASNWEPDLLQFF